MDLQDFITSRIAILKELETISKQKYIGTREDVSFIARMKIDTLEGVLNEWKELQTKKT